jgi:hypothetical protein
MSFIEINYPDSYVSVGKKKFTLLTKTQDKILNPIETAFEFLHIKNNTKIACFFGTVLKGQSHEKYGEMRVIFFFSFLSLSHYKFSKYFARSKNV